MGINIDNRAHLYEIINIDNIHTKNLDALVNRDNFIVENLDGQFTVTILANNQNAFLDQTAQRIDFLNKEVRNQLVESLNKELKSQREISLNQALLVNCLHETPSKEFESPTLFQHIKNLMQNALSFLGLKKPEESEKIENYDEALKVIGKALENDFGEKIEVNEHEYLAKMNEARAAFRYYDKAVELGDTKSLLNLSDLCDKISVFRQEHPNLEQAILKKTLGEQINFTKKEPEHLIWEKHAKNFALKYRDAVLKDFKSGKIEVESLKNQAELFLKKKSFTKHQRETNLLLAYDFFKEAANKDDAESLHRLGNVCAVLSAFYKQEGSLDTSRKYERERIEIRERENSS